MATHPTFVHAAADLRRQALLREAGERRRWPGAPTRSLPRRATHVVWVLATRLVEGITVVVDSFEPLPSPRPDRAVRPRS
jgi:hypothetical protein